MTKGNTSTLAAPTSSAAAIVTTWMCDNGHHRPANLPTDDSGAFTYNGHCAGTVRSIAYGTIVPCACDCHQVGNQCQ